MRGARAAAGWAGPGLGVASVGSRSPRGLADSPGLDRSKAALAGCGRRAPHSRDRLRAWARAPVALPWGPAGEGQAAYRGHCWGQAGESPSPAAPCCPAAAARDHSCRPSHTVKRARRPAGARPGRAAWGGAGAGRVRRRVGRVSCIRVSLMGHWTHQGRLSRRRPPVWRISSISPMRNWLRIRSEGSPSAWRSRCSMMANPGPMTGRPPRPPRPPAPRRRARPPWAGRPCWSNWSTAAPWPSSGGAWGGCRSSRRSAAGAARLWSSASGPGPPWCPWVWSWSGFSLGLVGGGVLLPPRPGACLCPGDPRRRLPGRACAPPVSRAWHRVLRPPAWACPRRPGRARPCPRRPCLGPRACPVSCRPGPSRRPSPDPCRRPCPRASCRRLRPSSRPPWAWRPCPPPAWTRPCRPHPGPASCPARRPAWRRSLPCPACRPARTSPAPRVACGLLVVLRRFAGLAFCSCWSCWSWPSWGLDSSELEPLPSCCSCFWSPDCWSDSCCWSPDCCCSDSCFWSPDCCARTPVSGPRTAVARTPASGPRTAAARTPASGRRTVSAPWIPASGPRTFFSLDSCFWSPDFCSLDSCFWSPGLLFLGLLLLVPGLLLFLGLLLLVPGLLSLALASGPVLVPSWTLVLAVLLLLLGLVGGLPAASSAPSP